jgi:hypothetical protein
MKRHAWKTVFLHIFFIILFAILYYTFGDQVDKNNKKYTPIDYIVFSSSVQSGVGITPIQPTTINSKRLIIIQYILFIMTNAAAIYLLAF